MTDIDFVVPGRPPPHNRVKAKPRGSLPSSAIQRDIHRLALLRHSSQPKLNKNAAGGSLVNLSRERSNSLVQLTDLKRTLSASNLAAVSDSNLSLKEAVPPRAYDEPNTHRNQAKQHFEQLTKTYFYQLTQGCGNEQCTNYFCQSSPNHMRVRPSAAALVGMELACRPRHYICAGDLFAYRALPQSTFSRPQAQPKSFLHTLFSCSPFKSLFQPSPTDPQGRVRSASVRGRPGGISANSLSKLNQRHPATATGAGAVPKKTRPAAAGQSSYFAGQSSSLSNLAGQPAARRGSLGSGDHWTASSPVVADLGLSPSLEDLLIIDGISSGGPSVTSSPSHLTSSNEALATSPADLEEFERECALEISMDDENGIREFSLTHLTLPMLMGPVEKYLECKDPAFLLNTIRTVFTSPEALNASFKLGENGVEGERLDVASVRKAYKILLGLQPHDIFQTAILNAVETLLSELTVNTPIKHNEINQLLILMENPLVQHTSKLLQKLCGVVAALSRPARHSLLAALQRYRVEGLKGHLRLLMAHLSSALKLKQGSEPALLDIAWCIALFHEINELAYQKGGKRPLPLEYFYSYELSRKLDYRMEFEKWKVMIENSRRDPVYSILHFPYLLDPASKVHILHLDAVVQMRKEYQDAILHQARVNQARKYIREPPGGLQDSVKSAMCPFLVLEVRRDHIVADTVTQIRRKQADLKKPLKIKYVGAGEQGLDMGGLQKEFFQLITQSIFDPDYGMFTYIEESRCIWINGSSLESDQEFEMVGIVLGLAIYNGVILDLHLPAAVYKKLQGVAVGLADLTQAQPALGQGLQQLLTFQGDVEDTFCQTFQVSHSVMGKTVMVDLIPGGANVPVTNQTRDVFVQHYVNFLLNQSVEKQFQAFARGFHLVCGSSALTLFKAEEIELLVCGSPELDFEALEASATYEDGFSRNHHAIKAFWSVVHSMSNEQKKKLLNFITGSDRVPLKGLSSLPIVIQRNGPDSIRLPTAMTCFNRLLMPSYHGKEKLRERLIIAIEFGKGFGLT